MTEPWKAFSFRFSLSLLYYYDYFVFFVKRAIDLERPPRRRTRRASSRKASAAAGCVYSLTQRAYAQSGRKKKKSRRIRDTEIASNGEPSPPRALAPRSRGTRQASGGLWVLALYRGTLALPQSAVFLPASFVGLVCFFFFCQIQSFGPFSLLILPLPFRTSVRGGQQRLRKCRNPCPTRIRNPFWVLRRGIEL